MKMLLNVPRFEVLPRDCQAYLITILVGDDERPWKEGWFPKKLLRPDPRYEVGDLDLIPVPDWMVLENGWKLPEESTEPRSGWEIARVLSEETGFHIGFIGPEDVIR